jgi:prophage DNA circulation protein
MTGIVQSLSNQLNIAQSDLTSTFLGGSSIAGPWRDAIPKTSFRGVEFISVENSSEVGRRLATHEFPQQDVPFTEDLGEKARIHNMSGYVIGSKWEANRDALINACRASGPGTLSHPELGKIKVYCQSCTFVENKTESGMMATFQFVFVEQPDTANNIAFVDTASKVKMNATTNMGLLESIFNAAYTLQNLPNFATTFITGQLTELIGFNPLQAVGVLSSFNNLLSTPITLPTSLSSAIANFTSSFNLDYTDQINGTNKITPLVAMNTCITNATKPLTYPQANTATSVAINYNCKLVEQLFKQCSVIQASVASTYINYASYGDAQNVWNQIISIFNTQIAAASDIGNNDGYNILRNAKADFVADIKARAPSLSKVTYKNISIPTPGLVIAYDMYEDITREDEIIARNNISNPSLIINTNLELLVQ